MGNAQTRQRSATGSGAIPATYTDALERALGEIVRDFERDITATKATLDAELERLRALSVTVERNLEQAVEAGTVKARRRAKAIEADLRQTVETIREAIANDSASLVQMGERVAEALRTVEERTGAAIDGANTRIREAEERIAQRLEGLRDGQDGRDGEPGPEGPPGPEGLLREPWAWGEREIAYRGDLVTHGGQLWQATKDVASVPWAGADGWRLLAAKGDKGDDGRGWTARGTHDPAASYEVGDVVAKGGSSFVAIEGWDDEARRACPGPAWQLVASRGSRGEGERGERGSPGRDAPRIAGIDLEGENLVFRMSDATTFAVDLYPVLRRLKP